MRVILHILLLLALTAALRTAAAQVAPSASDGSTARTDLAEREQRLRTYLKTQADAADARYLLAYTLFREDKAKDSLAEYTRAAKLRAPTAKDLQTVALDYVLLNDYTDADKWMSRSVTEQPDSTEAWYQLGRIKYTENRFTEALTCFQKALSYEPRNVKAENNLGLTLEGLNRTDEAVTAYRNALTWQKDSSNPSEQPMLNLAIVLTDRQQFAEALTLALAADHVAPRDPKISEQLGRIYFQTGELQKAEDAFMKASSLAPDKAAIHFELARVYRKEGKAELARKESDRVAALSGTKSTPGQP